MKLIVQSATIWAFYDKKLRDRTGDGEAPRYSFMSGPVVAVAGHRNNLNH